jgi:hypothetical protein
MSQPSPEARYNGKFLFYFVSGDEERMPMIKIFSKNFILFYISSVLVSLESEQRTRALEN